METYTNAKSFLSMQGLMNIQEKTYMECEFGRSSELYNKPKVAPEPEF